jgi:hypothetical protein
MVDPPKASAPPGAENQRPAPDQRRIDDAIRKAKEFLLANRLGGHWESALDPEHSVGLTALCALALVEAGVPREHDVIRLATSYVRSSLKTLNQANLPNNYSLCLAVLLLDKVCQDGDTDAIIKALAVRVAAAQVQQHGGWSYNCPQLSDAEFREWLDFLEKSEHKPIGDEVLRRLGEPGPKPVDNSNTQFAILALYKGWHHHAPATYPLLVAERRFRRTQADDGGWGYGAESGGSRESTPSMTAAGLLALALGYSAANEAGVTIVRSAAKFDAGDAGRGGAAGKPPVESLPLEKDPQVLAAQEYLVNAMRTRTAKTIGHFHYFLWSLDRVCMMFGWEKEIRGFDWYGWGASWLIETQAGDGSWSSDFQSGPIADTAFGLLFLVKSNLLPEVKLRTVVRAGNLLQAAGAPRPGKPIPPPAVAPAPAPPAAAQAANALVQTLINSDGKRQREALAKLRDTPGEEYTTALVDAIKRLAGGALQVEVRDALAERLSREDAKRIKARLASNEKELQLAAAWAAVLKDPRCKEVIPDIIKLLSDTDDRVAAKAHEALKILSDGEDFGKSAEKWNEWWEKTRRTRE